ncbi:MAG: hypothetical protein P1V51_09100 [Deltaproteobacteria bacterium]|nr:hypothetical protein [Deltaproteobacteria bacterium]
MMTSRSMLVLGSCLLLSAACLEPGPPVETSPSQAFVRLGDCSHLDPYSCEIRPDCVVDTCFLCSCTPFFRACRPFWSTPPRCPVLPCAQPDCCRDASECPHPEDVCAPPRTQERCEGCDGGRGDCEEDADCRFFEVCEPIPCSCTGARRCVRGCIPHRESCPSEEACGLLDHCPPGLDCSCSDHPRCLPPPCRLDGDCGLNHVCQAGACERRPCDSDSDCEGPCVLGECQERFGECLPGVSP